ncbi:hypothetical protein ABK730_09135 [Klebsiella indica]|uniref:hypothetical protein n=1 Tax=Klebsiella TaxID=570 RepID=UPI003751D243
MPPERQRKNLANDDGWQSCFSYCASLIAGRRLTPCPADKSDDLNVLPIYRKRVV